MPVLSDFTGSPESAVRPHGKAERHMKAMTRVWAIPVAVIMSAGILAGCGDDSGDEPAQLTLYSADQVTGGSAHREDRHRDRGDARL